VPCAWKQNQPQKFGQLRPSADSWRPSAANGRTNPKTQVICAPTQTVGAQAQTRTEPAEFSGFQGQNTTTNNSQNLKFIKTFASEIFSKQA
jgi:hypothetical protein